MEDSPSLVEVLSRVRRELNHLYTEPFSMVDAGLFCREHALHLLGIASALGHRTEICTGMFGMRIPGKITNAMTNSNGDHAWCRVDDVVPVDLSFTLKGLPLDRVDVGLVFGADPSFLSGFDLKYLVGVGGPEIEAMLAASPVDVLVYSEQAVDHRTALELHADPFQFLLPPLQAGAPTLIQLYGRHVFFAITLHCLRVARGQAKSITYRNQMSALATLAAWYPNAVEEMKREWLDTRHL